MTLREASTKQVDFALEHFDAILFRALDQSAAYMKNSIFGPFGGSEEDLRGTKKAKITSNVGALLGGPFLL